MSRTAETYIDKPRKRAHDVIAFMAGVGFLTAFVGFLTSQFGLVFFGGIAGVGLGRVASKIKYTLVKEVEVGGYKRV